MKNLNITFLILAVLALGVVDRDAVCQAPISIDLSAQEASSEGTMEGVSLQRSGVYKTKGVHQLNGLLWKSDVLCRPAENNSYYLPIVANGAVYFVCQSSNSRGNGIGGWNFYSDDYVYALDLKTGKQNWKVQMKESAFSSLAIAGSTVYFGSNTGYFGNEGGVFFALDAQTGQEKWSYKLKKKNLASASPAVANGAVYFRDMVGNLYALDTQTGKLIWSFNSKGELTVAAVFDGKVYFGDSKGSVYGVDAKTGEQIWKFDAPKPLGDPVISDGLVYLGD